MLRYIKPWKAPREDNIPIGLLKACGKPLYNVLAKLITSSFNAAYIPEKIRIAKIFVLSKLNKTKAHKSTPETWWPIVLFNTISKIIKTAFARLITNAAKKGGLCLMAKWVISEIG
jgi:hypothetical protein